MTITMEEARVNRKKKRTNRNSRRGVSQARCSHCDGVFWAPTGTVTCPWCGRTTEVKSGIIGSAKGFFSRMLEGIAISGGISEIVVSYP